MKNKILFIYIFIIISLCLLAFCSSTKVVSIKNVTNNFLTISIKDVNSKDGGFALLYLFRHGYDVQDTFADINGQFTIIDKNNLEGVIIRTAGCYPEYKTIKELEQDSIVFLKESEILMKTGLMGLDSILLEMNELLEIKINNWNLKN